MEHDTHRRPMPLMPEVAIVTTLALIAAPILLVAGTLAMAAKKRLRERSGTAPEKAAPAATI
jgi:hypothetical protein